MKDKEAQEKILELIRTKPHIYSSLYAHGTHATPREILLLIEELGYRKPLDRPELTDEWINKFCIDNGFEDAAVEGRTMELCKALLALSIPKDKPPLLSPKEITKAVGRFYSGGSSGLERAAQAQRELCIEWYEGD